MLIALCDTSAHSSTNASVISRPPSEVKSGSDGYKNKSFKYMIEPLKKVIVESCALYVKSSFGLRPTKSCATSKNVFNVVALRFFNLLLPITLLVFGYCSLLCICQRHPVNVLEPPAPPPNKISVVTLSSRYAKQSACLSNKSMSIIFGI